MALRPKMRRRRRTKIIATLGPASSTLEIMTRLFQAGADVFRLNFSHGTHEDHAARFAMIRELEEKFDRPIGILADVQGPKLRVGRFGGGRVHLQTGQKFRLDLNATPGDSLARQPAAPRDHQRRFDRLAPCCWTTANSASAWCTSAPMRWKPRSSSGGRFRTTRASTSPTSSCRSPR